MVLKYYKVIMFGGPIWSLFSGYAKVHRKVRIMSSASLV